MATGSRNAALLRELVSHADDLAASVSGDHFPVVLRKLADRRRVTGVEFRPLLVDAVLTTHSEGFRILLDSGESDPEALTAKYQSETREQLAETRLRFSLAHEFAHTLFYDLSSSRPTLAKQFRSGGGKRALDNLERNCDVIAGHLLLPTKLFEDAVLRMAVIEPQALIELANRAGVSVEALVRRFGFKSDILRHRYFRGCIAIVVTRDDGLYVRAVSLTRHLPISRDLDLLRSGEKWQVVDSLGALVNPASIRASSEFTLTAAPQGIPRTRRYRVDVAVIGRGSTKTNYLVMFNEVDV